MVLTTAQTTTFFQDANHIAIPNVTRVTLQQEGITTFYRGFMPMWARFAPYITIQLLMWEQLRYRLGYDNI